MEVGRISLWGLPCPYFGKSYFSVCVSDSPPPPLFILFFFLSQFWCLWYHPLYSFISPCHKHTWHFFIFHRKVRDVYLGLSSVSLWHWPLWCINGFIMTQPAAETCSTLHSTPRSHHTCCFGSTVPKSVGVLSKKCAPLLPVWMKWKVWIYQKCRLQIIRLYKQ